MSMRMIAENNRVIFKLVGDIDHHNAKAIREEIDGFTIENHPRNLVLDFKGVEFMDSSGIGLVLGRYKLMAEIGGKLILENLPNHLRKVMKVAGIEKLEIQILQGGTP